MVLPLFPPHASATTASVFDAVAAWARGRRAVPGIRFVRGFADHPAWIDALAAAVREARHAFLEAGGESFLRVPCPNASEPMGEALARIAREHLLPSG